MICTIYILTNPINNTPFYVGKTKSSLKVRLSSHITEAKTNSALLSPKNTMIRKILLETKKPIISCVERFDCEKYTNKELIKREQWWLAHYSIFFPELTNVEGTGRRNKATKESKLLVKKLDIKGDGTGVFKLPKFLVTKIRENKKKTGISIKSFIEQAIKEKLKIKNK